MEDERFQTCTKDQVQVFELIGQGMQLFVPFDGSGAKLIPDRRICDIPERKLREGMLESLLATNLLGKLSENRTNQKIGWREAGLPGELGDLYAMVQ